MDHRADAAAEIPGLQHLKAVGFHDLLVFAERIKIPDRFPEILVGLSVSGNPSPDSWNDMLSIGRIKDSGRESRRPEKFKDQQGGRRLQYAMQFFEARRIIRQIAHPVGAHGGIEKMIGKGEQKSIGANRFDAMIQCGSDFVKPLLKHLQRKIETRHFAGTSPHIIERQIESAARQIEDFQIFPVWQDRHTLLPPAFVSAKTQNPIEQIVGPADLVK